MDDNQSNSNQRLIVLDTETTGLSPKEGHRIIEIGCVELVGLRKTGNDYHQYINPEREIPAEAIEVHGITNEKVADCPTFDAISPEFLDYIGDAELVIHNAAFDMGFINHHLEALGVKAISMDRAIDSLILARRKFPGQPANLDALCKRLGVDNSNRTFHGALLDAALLADVFVELKGGAQFRLELKAEMDKPATIHNGKVVASIDLDPSSPLPARSWPVGDAEVEDHENFCREIHKESGACFWLPVETHRD